MGDVLRNYEKKEEKNEGNVFDKDNPRRRDKIEKQTNQEEKRNKNKAKAIGFLDFLVFVSSFCKFQDHCFSDRRKTLVK